MLVMLAATVAGLLLRSNGQRALGSAVTLLTLAGLLLYAFVKSGRDTRVARTWAESWRRRHLLMIALSIVVGFSALLVPDADTSAWVLVPIVLGSVPLLFTPLAHLGKVTSSADD